MVIDHLRFSLILPFYTGKENGDRGDGALTFIFSSIKHALGNDVMFPNEHSSLCSFQRGTTNSPNCCKSFEKIGLYRLYMTLLNLLLMWMRGSCLVAKNPRLFKDSFAKAKLTRKGLKCSHGYIQQWGNPKELCIRKENSDSGPQIL